jgi:Putative auto-transporter adhesin, head GIN domain
VYSKKLCFVLAGLVLSGCQFKFMEPAIRGSGTMIREARDVQPFDRVNVSGGAHVEILSGQTGSSCEVECDDNLLEHLATTVEGGELTIRFVRSISSTQAVRIWLSTEHLSQLSASGSVQGTVVGLDEPSTKLDVSGSAKLKCAGKVGKLEISASGSANFDCLELAADDVVISISGSGKANVQALRTLKVNVSGSGNVKYLGTPKIDKSISGSGSVKPFEE